MYQEWDLSKLVGDVGAGGGGRRLGRIAWGQVGTNRSAKRVDTSEVGLQGTGGSGEAVEVCGSTSELKIALSRLRGMGKA